MRIFYALLIIMGAAILFMLPITSGIYDFRTDLHENTFYEMNGVGDTVANVTLSDEVYDDDTATVSIFSDLSTDLPALVSYNTTTRVLDISGLTESANRTLTVEYDIDALNASEAVGTFLGYVPAFWLICVIALPVAALAAIFTNRA